MIFVRMNFRQHILGSSSGIVTAQICGDMRRLIRPPLLSAHVPHLNKCARAQRTYRYVPPPPTRTPSKNQIVFVFTSPECPFRCFLLWHESLNANPQTLCEP